MSWGNYNVWNFQKISLENKEYTGLNCPAKGDPFYYIGAIDEKNPSTKFYAGFCGQTPKTLYSQDIESPYINY